MGALMSRQPEVCDHALAHATAPIAVAVRLKPGPVIGAAVPLVAIHATDRTPDPDRPGTGERARP